MCTGFGVFEVECKALRDNGMYKRCRAVTK